MTVDGQRFCLYEDGDLVASTAAPGLAASREGKLWFGTDAEGMNLWNGRIDEVTLFDRSLSDVEIRNLYQAALKEIRKSE